MKLAELLNVDTTKENWFKLLNKKGINPKTVNAVSKGGGGGDNITTLEQFLNKYKNIHVVYEIESGGFTVSRWYYDISRYKIANMDGLQILVVECDTFKHGMPIVFDNNIYEEKQEYNPSVLNSIETANIDNDMYIGIFSQNLFNGIFDAIFVMYVENLDLI